MKKIVLGLGLFFTTLSATARADVIQCADETNTSIYSMSQGTLKVTTRDNDGKIVKTKSISGVSFQIKAPGQFDLLLDKDKTVLATLTLDNKGTDDNCNIDPFSAVFTEAAAKIFNLDKEARYQGCSSNYLKPTHDENACGG